MSGYSDHYKDMRHAEWLNEWTPDGIGGVPLDERNLRYWIARAREAEATVKAHNDAIKAVKKAFSL